MKFGGAEIAWQKIAERGAEMERFAAGREVFDADRVGSSIILRHWRAGDRFQPIGMAAAVKLQDWFTNRKIPTARRRNLIVAATARGEIFWIEDQRIGERFKLTPATRNHLVWQWNRAKTGAIGSGGQASLPAVEPGFPARRKTPPASPNESKRWSAL